MINVIVVFPKIEDASNIKKLMMRNGYHVTGVCTSGAQALLLMEELADGIVLCGYKFTDMLYTQLYANLPPHFHMILAASPFVLSECRNNDIVCLALPLKVHDLINTLEMMSGNLLRQRRRRNQKPKGRNEQQRKVIEEAKRLLMERNNMTEDEAHHYLQKCSMDSGTSMVESAEMVFALMKF